MNNATVNYNGNEIPLYKATQKQRAMERQIRFERSQLVSLNESIEIAKSAGNNELADDLLINFESQSVKLKRHEAMYKDYCEQTDLPVLSERLQYPTFNRSVSQKAVQSAKRHFEEWKSYLPKDIAPKSLANYYKIKYNNPEQYLVLQDVYKSRKKIIDKYETNYGYVSSDDIIRLDNSVKKAKTQFDYSNLTGKNKTKIKRLSTQGNSAVMDFDEKTYYSHSSFGLPDTMEINSYKGEFPAVGLKPKQERLFKVVELGDGIPREYDTEAKFLEYVATNKKEADSFSIIILSEKHICKSCQSVVKQFKKRFPNADINIVSGKEVVKNEQSSKTE